jgi:hypothetical protein
MKEMSVHSVIGVTLAAVSAIKTLERIRKRSSQPSLITYRCQKCGYAFEEKDICEFCDKCTECCDCGWMKLCDTQKRSTIQLEQCPQCKKSFIGKPCECCGKCYECCPNSAYNASTHEENEIKVEICCHCNQGIDVDNYCQDCKRCDDCCRC